MSDFPDFFRQEQAVSLTPIVRDVNRVIGAALTVTYGPFYVGNWEAIAWSFRGFITAGAYELQFIWSLDGSGSTIVYGTDLLLPLNVTSLDASPILAPFVTVVVNVPSAVAAYSLTVAPRRHLDEFMKAPGSSTRLAGTTAVIAAGATTDIICPIASAGLVSCCVTANAFQPFVAGLFQYVAGGGVPTRAISRGNPAAGGNFNSGMVHAPNGAIGVVISNTSAVPLAFDYIITGFG